MTDTTRPPLRPGSRLCECGGCGERFGSLTGFDKHRVGDWAHRRCLTPGEIAATGLVRDGQGIWRRPFTSARVARGVGLVAAGVAAGDA